MDRPGHDRRGARPPLRKALGQHHLRSASSCRPLLERLGSVKERGDAVLEIGPGGGVLTGELLAAGGRVLALELDARWAFHLRRRFAHERLSVAVADALEVAWERLPRSCGMVVGNLPYNVATAILERLLDRAPPGLELAFLVQREVAERIVATPGGKVYGSLSVLVQARGGPRILGRVRPGAFWPPPKVESAFFALRLEAWSHETVPWPEFKDLVRDAFKHRRKMLAGGLRRTWGDAAPAILEAAGIDRSARAESLGVADFRRLASARAALASAASGDANPR